MFPSYNNEVVFRNHIQTCLEKIKLILDANKANSIQPANSVEHRYEDKFLLANYLVNTSFSSVLDVLSHLGLTAPILAALIEWSKEKDVSLRFESVETCAFVKETKRQVEDPVRQETTKSGMGFATSYVSRTYTTITEYVYEFSAEYRVSAFRGVGERDQDGVVLMKRNNAKHTINLRAKESPYPAATKTSRDVNISFLLRSINDKTIQPRFEINRSSNKCFTPYRNEDIKSALEGISKLDGWCSLIHSYFTNSFFRVEVRHRDPATGNQPLPDLSVITAVGVFNPIAPLFEDNQWTAASSLSSAVVDDVTQPSLLTASATATENHSNVNDTLVSVEGNVVSDTTLSVEAESSVVLNSYVQNQLMAEESRSLESKLSEVTALFPAGSTTTKLITSTEVTLVISVLHIRDLASSLSGSLMFVEEMLRKQLVAAVGKVLQASDFAEYMKFHNRKLFKPEYQPVPFSHSVRRSVTHSPEGTVRIEETGSAAEPINTVSSTASPERTRPMQFVLNASTKVTIGGDRTLHACLMHRFSGQAMPELHLVSEARQFSSFIVLVGRIASATLFEPKYGIIVQNKDEIKIPLDLEQIPTPKEFKDAIKSLSPEQQRFAQAYRSMQLESTLFGICIIQIKPQLEKVLKLLPDSLTKEIRLTQDLMELFIKYQIPSDLLTYEGSESADAGTRLTAVKGHVKAIQSMIQDSKEREVEAQKQQREYEGKRELKALESYQSADRMMMMGEGCAPPPPSMTKSAGGSSLGSMMRRSSGAPAYLSPPTPMAMSAFSAGVPKTESSSFGSPGLKPASVPSTSAPGSMTAPVATSTANQPQAKNLSTALAGGSGSTVALDYTQYPGLLDKAYERFDVDSALRPTIINPGKLWTKRSQKALLEAPTTTTLTGDALGTEKNAAFDLLDALSRSGALTVDCASLHIVIAATHCFDDSLMDTVVQSNVNPIERVERSTLIMAATVHGVASSQLVTDTQLPRVSTYSPMLFIDNNTVMDI